MKNAIVIAMLLCSIFGNSQKAEIVSIVTNQRMIPALIDGKYAITIFLAFEDFDQDYTDVYSVSGWYVYDNKQVKIPLAGIYCNGLTLYSFASDENHNQIITLDVDASHGSERIDELQDMKGFDEKFTFTEIGGNYLGQWQKSGKKLPVTLAFPQEIAVYKKMEFLRIPGEIQYSINLRELQLHVEEFSLEGYFEDKDETRALLRYECMSRKNVQTMCGAGLEIGYVTLRFDQKMKFKSSEDLRIESCLNGLGYDTDKQEKSKISVKNYNGQPTTHYRIDTATARVIILKS